MARRSACVRSAISLGSGPPHKPRARQRCGLYAVWPFPSVPSFLLNAYAHLRHRRHRIEPFPAVLGHCCVRYNSHLRCESPGANTESAQSASDIFVFHWRARWSHSFTRANACNSGASNSFPRMWSTSCSASATWCDAWESFPSTR